MRAFGYLRISHDPSGSSISPDRQRVEIERVAAAKGFDVVEWFEDRDASAFRKVHRPGFEAMLLRLDEVRAVFVYELSRSARRMAVQMDFLDTLEEKGIRLVSVTQGDTGEGQRFVFDVLAAADAEESRKLSARIRSAKDFLASSGKLPFNARSFGFRRDGDALVWVDAEVEWLRYMVRRYLEGAGTLQIATELSDAGAPTVLGGTWSPTSVLNQLRSPRLLGFATYHGEPTSQEPVGEPVLDAATYRRLQAEIRRRSRQHVRAPRSDTELTGLLYCKRCEGRMFAQHSIRRGGSRYEVYHCRKRAGHSTSIAKSFVEAEVAQRLFRKVDEHREGLAEQEAVLDDTHDPDAALRGRIEHLRWRLSELDHDYWQGGRTLGRETYYEQRAALEETVALLTDKLTEHADTCALHVYAETLGDLREVWPHMTHGERHQMFALWIERVIVSPVGRGHGRRASRIDVCWR